mmetsp:Transcript_4647/g.11091  ORF Transcript_4647/g.11091 Transcript_4647/m.11091 type:complete len:90 (-) Transcript_4647:144-413(-)
MSAFAVCEGRGETLPCSVPILLFVSFYALIKCFDPSSRILYVHQFHLLRTTDHFSHPITTPFAQFLSHPLPRQGESSQGPERGKQIRSS